MNKLKNKFKFSIIISVYNTDKWIREAVDSVINQDIGFEDNVQIIFINDGSTDNSEKICLEYQEKYPNNIIYRKKKNGGVSSAKNLGLRLVEGEYVNFFDPDDILSLDTLSAVYKFFKKHDDEIDLVSIKLVYFEAKQGDHYLNYKFEKDAVIDLNKQFDFPQLSSASAFFRYKSIGSLRFDESLKISEDAKFITYFLSDKMKYGVLSTPTYYYRKRTDFSSAINSRNKSDYWYTIVLDRFYLDIIDYSLKNHSYVTRYVQYLILYDLNGMIMDKNDTSVLSKKQTINYEHKMEKILGYIDEDVILAERNLKREYKLFLLSKKYDEVGENCLSVNADGVIEYRNYPIYQLKHTKASIYIIDIKNNNLYIEGYFTGFKVSDVDVYFVYKSTKYKVTRIDSEISSSTYMKRIIHKRNWFKVTIPIDNCHKNSEVAMFCGNGHNEYSIGIRTTETSKLSQYSKFSYRSAGNKIIKTTGNVVLVKNKTPLVHLFGETLFFAKLLKDGRLKAVGRRILVRIFRVFYKKPIWIILFHDKSLNDNYSILLHEIASLGHDKYKIYITNIKDANPKLLFLLADKIILPEFESVRRLFGNDEYLYRDLFKFKIIVLQCNTLKKQSLSKCVEYINIEKDADCEDIYEKIAKM